MGVFWISTRFFGTLSSGVNNSYMTAANAKTSRGTTLLSCLPAVTTDCCVFSLRPLRSLETTCVHAAFYSSRAFDTRIFNFSTLMMTECADFSELTLRIIHAVVVRRSLALEGQRTVRCRGRTRPPGKSNFYVI